MQDKLLIASKIKKTIEYIDKAVSNYPHGEIILKNKIMDNCYDLLEIVYKANVFKEDKYMKELITKIRMLNYYIEISLEKKLISFKKFENVGKHLLEISKMVNVWMKNEKEKQSI